MVEVRLQELNNSPQQRENYKIIAAINQRLTEMDTTVVVQGIRLNTGAISILMMLHDIALSIAGCQGFIPILRMGRNNPAFMCLLK